MREEIVELQQALKKAIVTAEESSSKRQKFEDGYRVKVIELRNVEEKLRLATFKRQHQFCSILHEKILTDLQKKQMQFEPKCCTGEKKR